MLKCQCAYEFVSFPSPKPESIQCVWSSCGCVAEHISSTYTLWPCRKQQQRQDATAVRQLPPVVPCHTGVANRLDCRGRHDVAGTLASAFPLLCHVPLGRFDPKNRHRHLPPTEMLPPPRSLARHRLVTETGTRHLGVEHRQHWQS